MKKLNLPKSSNVVFNSICLIVLLITGSIKVEAQQTKPFHYWTFEGSNPLKDSMNNSSLNSTTYKSIYSIAPPSAGGVGNSLKIDTAGRTFIATPNFVLPTNVVTVEFLFKPAPDFSTSSFIHRVMVHLILSLVIPTFNL